MASGNLNDYPELKAVFDKLMAEREAIHAQTKHLHDEYKRLGEEARPINMRMRELAKEWQAIERPRLIQIDTQLSAIARSVGGKVLTTTEAK